MIKKQSQLTIVTLTLAAISLFATSSTFAQDESSGSPPDTPTVSETTTPASADTPEVSGEEEEAKAELNSGDTAWMLTATVLVLLMTLPGLALFYGGLVRVSNVLSVLVHCLILAAIMTIVWVVYGYSLAAGEGSGVWNKFIGNLDNLGLKNIGEGDGNMPESVWITFQMTFIIITPALIVGAFAERMKFKAMIVFSILWVTFSYLPAWHMAWGEGLFHEWGVIDFAGGTVVHINAGIAGLIACMMVGKRKGLGTPAVMPHSVPFTVIGACLLWVGWFGFNAGSAGAANDSAGFAMLTTQVAAAAAILAWMLIEYLITKKPTAVGAATGAVAGLVAITPASGSTTINGAIIIGATSGFICYFFATYVKRKLKYDDSLDVFGVHGVGGIIGAILTGVFIRESYMLENGIEDTGKQVLAQFGSVVVTMAWSAVVSVVALTIARIFCGGLRVTEVQEQRGLDTTVHGEAAYTNH